MWGIKYTHTHTHTHTHIGASLVVHWITICLAMQGTLVQSLVQEDPMCHVQQGLRVTTTELTLCSTTPEICIP